MAALTDNLDLDDLTDLELVDLASIPGHRRDAARRLATELDRRSLTIDGVARWYLDLAAGRIRDPEVAAGPNRAGEWL